MNRQDVLVQAVETLDTYGFADLSMRRLASSLGVQPGALYWHFANKQSLLLAIAEVILADLPNGTEGATAPSDTQGGTPDDTECRAPDDTEFRAPKDTEGGTAPGDASTAWDDSVRRWAGALRAALLSRRDGAELVASVLALRPPGLDPASGCLTALITAGLPPLEAAAAGAALVHYVVGHSVDAQNHAQARELGVREVRDTAEDEATAVQRFDYGLAIFVDGLRARLP